MMHEIAQSVAEAKTKGGATGGSILDPVLFGHLTRHSRWREGGRAISEEIGMFSTSRVCRFPIAGSGLDMVICGEPATMKSYCKACYALAYYPQSSRAAEFAAKAVSKSETAKPAEPERIYDLCGELVE